MAMLSCVLQEVCLDCGDNPTEHSGGHDVHLVQKYEAPFAGCQEVHHLFRVMGPVVGVGHHRVGRYDDAAFAGKLAQTHPR